MSIYDEMAAEALAILEEFAQDGVKLTSYEITPAADKREADTKTPTTLTLHAAVRGVSRKYINGQDIVGSDEQITCATTAIKDSDGSAVAVNPEMTDTVTIGGADRRIKKIINIPAAGTPVVHVLIVEA